MNGHERVEHARAEHAAEAERDNDLTKALGEIARTIRKVERWS